MFSPENQFDCKLGKICPKGEKKFRVKKIDIMIINFDRKDRANDEEAMIEKVDLNRLSSTLRFRSILRVLIKIKQ